MISSEGTALGASLVCGGLLVFAADPPEPPRGGTTAPDSKRKRSASGASGDAARYPPRGSERERGGRGGLERVNTSEGRVATRDAGPVLRQSLVRLAIQSRVAKPPGRTAAPDLPGRCGVVRLRAEAAATDPAVVRAGNAGGSWAEAEPPPSPPTPPRSRPLPTSLLASLNKTSTF